MGKIKMKAKEVWYDDEADVLNVEINDKEYWKSVELPNGVVIDISKDGSMTSIEILNASKLFFGDAQKVIENAKSVSDVEWFYWKDLKEREVLMGMGFLISAKNFL